MKLYKSILTCIAAVAIATGFTSCDENFDYPPVSAPEIVGNGSSKAPYNVSTALLKIYRGDYAEWRDYYIKGIISKIDAAAFDPSYGNITYYISDDGTESNEFEIYRGLGLTGAKFSSASDLSVGDEVVVVCKMTYYNSSVAESKQGAILVSLNGSAYPTFEDAGEPTGLGTATSPFNVLGALEYTFAEDFVTNSKIYVKGIVSYIDATSFSASYGNINYYISDTGNRFNEYYCYRGLGLNGAKFTSATDIKVGDEVVVYGPVSLFSGATAEFNQGNQIVSINGGGTITPPDQPGEKFEPKGDGTAASPYNIAKALELLNNKTYTSSEVYIEGIVSSIKELSTQYGNCTYYLSDDGKTGDQLYVYRGYGLNGEKFASENDLKVGDKLVIKGVLTIYEGTYSSPQVNQGSSIVSINGGGSGGDTPQPPTPGGGEIYSGLTANADGWSFDVKSMPEGATYIWAWKEYNGSGYLNGSAYVNGAAGASEAYAFTTVDLTGVAGATATFDHTAKFQTTLRTMCSMVIRQQGASEWTKLTIPTWPEAGSWTFVNAGSIDISAYAGKKVEIGFLYGSSTSGADTWEIKNFVVTAK